MENINQILARAYSLPSDYALAVSFEENICHNQRNEEQHKEENFDLNSVQETSGSVIDHEYQSIWSIDSTNSESLQALPPISYEHIYKDFSPPGNSNEFYDSFFGRNELERYFRNHKVRLAMITWNMSSRPPKDYHHSLQKLLHLKPYQPPNFDQEHLPELFVIGLQEAPNSDTIMGNIKIGIQSVLGPNHVLLRWCTVGTLHCSLWIRRELLWSCTTVDMVPINTRMKATNRIKTKGAIAISFSLFGTWFLFVNTHLSPHENKLEERIDQIERMQQKLYNRYSLKIPPFISSCNHNQHNDRNESKYVFWFGDLNFRLEMTTKMAFYYLKQIEKADTYAKRKAFLSQMLRADQLNNLINRDLILEGFKEAQWPPPFLPTYKCKVKDYCKGQFKDQESRATTLFVDSPTVYTNGTIINSMYDMESGRVPSYTDRILYHSYGDRNGEPSKIQCLYYNSIPSICSSDHKPVYALFELKLIDGKKITKNNSNMTQLNKLLDEVKFFKENGRKLTNNSNGFYRFKNMFRKSRISYSNLDSLDMTTTNCGSLFLSNKRSNVEFNQLNAGAYNRKIYLDGMKLRNNRMQSLSLENIKRNNSLNECGISKSYSFEYNIISPSENVTPISPLVDRNDQQPDSEAKYSRKSQEPQDNRSGICKIV